VAAYLTTTLIAGCELLAHPSGAPPDSSADPYARSLQLQHEALVFSTANSSPSTLSVLYPPPPSQTESPDATRPVGDDVVWAPGYWVWDTSVDNWVWVRGVWVHPPPGRRWVPGYWGIVADGWRWVPGYWAADPPPPSNSTPPVVAYGLGPGYINDPYFGWYTGYGMWWLGYRHRHFHDQPPNRGPTPPLPPAHGAATAIALHGPHAADYLSSLTPSLASKLHPTAPASPPHLDLTSIPIPKVFELPNQHPLLALHSMPNRRGEIAAPTVLHDHAGRISSLFVNPHLETAFHEHLSFHGAHSSHSFAGEHSVGSGHASSSHGSGGHGGGHGH
jgi:hypothetical protein